jgi:hypothetical protein
MGSSFWSRLDLEHLPRFYQIYKEQIEISALVQPAHHIALASSRCLCDSIQGLVLKPAVLWVAPPSNQHKVNIWSMGIIKHFFCTYNFEWIELF